MRDNPYATSDGWAFVNSSNTIEDHVFKSREVMCIGFHNFENRDSHLYVMKRPSEFLRSSVLGRVRYLKAQCAEFHLVDVTVHVRVAVPFLDISAPKPGGYKSFKFHIMDGGTTQHEPLLDCNLTSETHGMNIPLYRSRIIEHFNVPDESSDEYHGALYAIVFEYECDQNYGFERPVDQIGCEIEIAVFLTYNFGTKGAQFDINPSFYET